MKRRLPGDVKSKLAKVARIAVIKLLCMFLFFFLLIHLPDVLRFLFSLKQASQGNVSGELINRLMSIVGHLIQVRSLKVQRLVI